MFLVPLLAVLLVGVAVPISVPKARGDDTGSPSLTFTGYLTRGYSDPYLNTAVDAIQAGNTLTFNVLFTANSLAYQRNLTMGIKFDWMTNYQNKTSDIAVFDGQTVTVSLSYTIPVLAGQYANLNQAANTWNLELLDISHVGESSISGCRERICCNGPHYPSD